MRYAIVLIVTIIFVTKRAWADPNVQLAPTIGVGDVVLGVAGGRLALAPGLRLLVGGEEWAFRAAASSSVTGPAGGAVGVQAGLSVGLARWWEGVDVSLGVGVLGYWSPVCGPRYCARLLGVAPAADVQVDVYGPMLSGALGLAITGQAAWITGRASPTWSGIEIGFTAGPILRFSRK